MTKDEWLQLVPGDILVYNYISSENGMLLEVVNEKLEPGYGNVACKIRKLPEGYKPSRFDTTQRAGNRWVGSLPERYTKVVPAIPIILSQPRLDLIDD